MANGFATGVSSTPLDIASAGQIFMRSAVETRLAEIQANKLEVSENVEKALKAMSISTIEGLSQNMRVRYQKEIEKYRDNVRNKLISNQGKFSLDDEREIQDGFVDLQKRQAADVYQLKQLAQAQDLIVKDINSYDPRAIDELRQMEEAMDKGELVGDPMTIVLKNRVPASVGDIVSKFYGHELAMLGKMVEGGFSGNVFSQTEMVGLVDPNTQKLTDKATNLRDRLLDDPRIAYRYTKPDGSFDEEAYAGVKQEIEDNITQVIKEVKPYRQSTGGSGSRTSPVELYPVEGTTYNWPQDTPQTPRTISVGEAKNVETGVVEKIDDNIPVSVVGFDPVKGTVSVKTEGGFVKKSGKPVFVSSDKAGQYENETVAEKARAGRTEDAIKKDAFTILAGQSSARKSEWSRAVDVELTDNGDGTKTLSGTLEKHGGKAFGADVLWTTGMRSEEDIKKRGENLLKEERVSITFTPMTDEKEAKTLELPLSQYRGLLTPIQRKKSIQGYTIEELMDNPSLIKGQQGVQKGNDKDPLGIL